MKLSQILLNAVFFFLTACASQSDSLTKSATTDTDNVTEAINCSPDNGLPTSACAETVSATFDSKGILWLSWVFADHLYIQSSSDKGASFSAPVMVNPLPESIVAHQEYRPKIQLDSNGNLYLTWTQSLENKSTSNIRFSRSQDGGKSFSSPITISENANPTSRGFDELAIGKNGEIFIVWQDSRDKEKAKAHHQEYAGSSIYYTWSKNAGSSFAANKLVAGHASECCRLAARIDNNNQPVLVMRNIFSGGIRDHALVKFKNWHTPAGPLRLDRNSWKTAVCPQHGPDLAISASNTYHAVWFSGNEKQPGLFYAHTQDNGRATSPAIHFGGPTASNPSISAKGKHLAIAWTENDGKNTVVQMMHSNNDGQSWSAPQEVNSSTNPTDYAFLITDQDKIYLSWLTKAGYQLKALELL